MKVTETMVKEPVKACVLYSSKNIVVALIEGSVYVSIYENGDDLTPIMIPVGDKQVYMNAENVAKMEAREYKSFDGMAFRRSLPDNQFDDAIKKAIPPVLPSDTEMERGQEFHDIWEILSEQFADELRKAQNRAFDLRKREEESMFYNEFARVKATPDGEGDFTREEFMEWFPDRCEVLDLEDINHLIEEALNKRHKTLSYDEIKDILDPVIGEDVVLYLHTIYKGHDYCGSFQPCRGLEAICDQPYDCGIYSDDDDFEMTPEVQYILDHPDEFKWWFDDPENQQADLEDRADGFRRVAKALDAYMGE